MQLTTAGAVAGARRHIMLLAESPAHREGKPRDVLVLVGPRRRPREGRGQRLPVVGPLAPPVEAAPAAEQPRVRELQDAVAAVVLVALVELVHLRPDEREELHHVVGTDAEGLRNNLYISQHGRLGEEVGDSRAARSAQVTRDGDLEDEALEPVERHEAIARAGGRVVADMPEPVVGTVDARPLAGDAADDPEQQVEVAGVEAVVLAVDPRRAPAVLVDAARGHLVDGV